MKHIIRAVSASLLFSTFLSYSAAESSESTPITSIVERRSQPVTIEDLIGLSSSSRGKHAFITSLCTEDKSSCSVTFVYSEHALLQDREILGSIAQRLSQLKVGSDYTEFQTLCKEEMKKHVLPALTDQQPTDATSLQAYSWDLIAVSILLGTEYWKHTGYNGCPSSATNNLWMDKPMHLLATNSTPFPEPEVITDPQRKAEELQKKHPEKPFHFVINLAKWRTVVAEEYKAKKAAREAAAPTMQISKEMKEDIRDCIQQ